MMLREQLRAISDPIRAQILQHLSKGEQRAGAIASHFSVTRPAISQHLNVLRDVGLIRVRREAQSRLYSIDVEAVQRLRVSFDQFWNNALPRLKSVVESDSTQRRRHRD